VRISPHERHTLENGVRLILLPRHDVPLISFEALVRGRARLDPEARAGLASVTAELLTRGAGEHSAYAFADAVEGAGGSLDAGAHSEALVLHGQFLSHDRELMLELLADALQRARFEPGELERVRTRRIEFIKAAKDSEPQSLIDSYGRALLFGAHPYGHPIGGSEHSLAGIERADVLKYYDAEIGADRLMLVFAGDFVPATLRREVAQALSGWRTAGAPLPTPQRTRGRQVLLIDAPGSAQTYFWLANVGVARQFPQRAALEITNTAFGGSFGSMLMQALRVRNGLTYAAGSSFRRGGVPGEFTISSFTQTQSTGQALEVALETLDTLKHEGAQAPALDSARSYILGQYPLNLETSADWAGALAVLDLFGLPGSYIEDFPDALRAVDEAASRQVIDCAFPHSEDLDIVLIGDAARIRAQAERLGHVLEKALSAQDFQPPAHARAPR
jgi:zinc protease